MRYWRRMSDPGRGYGFVCWRNRDGMIRTAGRYRPSQHQQGFAFLKLCATGQRTRMRMPLLPVCTEVTCLHRIVGRNQERLHTHKGESNE